MRTLFFMVMAALCTMATTVEARPYRGNGYNNAAPRHYVRPFKAHKIPANAPTNDWSFFGLGDLVESAGKHVGKNARQLGLPPSLWCADFINMLTASGKDRTARSYMSRGIPAQSGCIGCVAVLTRSGGGHVGVVKDYNQRGDPIIISGNHGGRVAISPYAKQRVIGYRWVPDKTLPKLPL